MDQSDPAYVDHDSHEGCLPQDLEVAAKGPRQTQLDQPAHLPGIREEHDRACDRERTGHTGNSPMQADHEPAERDGRRKEHEGQEQSRSPVGLVDVPVEGLEALCDSRQAE